MSFTMFYQNKLSYSMQLVRHKKHTKLAEKEVYHVIIKKKLFLFFSVCILIFYLYFKTIAVYKFNFYFIFTVTLVWSDCKG